MKKLRIESIFATACVCALFGCSGAAPVQIEEPPQSGTKAEAKTPEGLAVQGIHGTISRSEVETVFSNRMGELRECYTDAVEVFEDIEGTIEFFFTVDPGGKVSKAYVSLSNLGSLEAEKCMLGKLTRFRFPEPEGGAAEVQYDLVLEAPYDPPKPMAWTNEDVGNLLEAKRAVIEECVTGDEGGLVTVWVGPGGRVYATGASGGSEEAYSSATCLAQQARTWIFPDPGREIAKVRLDF